MPTAIYSSAFVTEMDAPALALAGQPQAQTTRDGVEYTLLGTAHVSRVSVDAVRKYLRARGEGEEGPRCCIESRGR